MKTIKLLFLFLAVLVPQTTSNVYALGDDVSPEATEEVRQVAAKEKLGSEPGSVVLYAKGLCCPSCAIGVRKMIGKLDFVDRGRFNKGVDLDTKTQLVTVAIGDGEKPDLNSLSQAVWSAGYDPVRAYKLKNGKLLSEALAAKAVK